MSNLFGAGLGNRGNEPVTGRKPILGAPRNIPAKARASPPWQSWEMVQDRPNPTASTLLRPPPPTQDPHRSALPG